LPVTYEEWEQHAWEEWERIPAEYKEGIDGLVLERNARRHPELEDVYTLGECVTESYPSAYGGPDTIRSAVVLYYGSFLRLSKMDSDFDWETELWETLTHELQHHLESLAADDSLIDVDYAMDESFKRERGEPFDPGYYRYGEPTPDGWYRLEEEYYTEPEPAPDGRLEFAWAGRRYRFEPPDAGADLLYLRVVRGVPDAPRALWLVWRQPIGWFAALRTLFRRDSATTDEADVYVEPVE
jgi:hypothetical protein